MSIGPTYRLNSKYGQLFVFGDSEEAIHVGREFYRNCLNAGSKVTAQVVLPGSRYKDSEDADALFRPKD